MRNYPLSRDSRDDLAVLQEEDLVNIFGQALQLSHWVLDVSPFTHVPKLPGGTVTATPFLWLGVIALALGAAGLAALRRRDIG